MTLTVTVTLAEKHLRNDPSVLTAHIYAQKNVYRDRFPGVILRLGGFQTAKYLTAASAHDPYIST